MRSIADGVHDRVAVVDAALDSPGTPPVQRPRPVERQGAVERVCHPADHGRFEHGLGVSDPVREAPSSSSSRTGGGRAEG